FCCAWPPRSWAAPGGCCVCAPLWPPPGRFCADATAIAANSAAALTSSVFLMSKNPLLPRISPCAAARCAGFRADVPEATKQTSLDACSSVVRASLFRHLHGTFGVVPRWALRCGCGGSNSVAPVPIAKVVGLLKFGSSDEYRDRHTH